MKSAPLRFFAAVVACAQSSVAADDDQYITCGSAVKLTHVESGGKFVLTSDERQLQSGSGQQLVTAVSNDRSPKGLWQVREGHDAKFCETATPVKCGQVIRLMHLETGSNLHTHGIRSPLSNQHEVTGFGQAGEGDAGDDWEVVCEGAGYFSGSKKFWMKDTPIQFKSTGTKRYLGASSTVKFTEQNCGRGCPILNQLEVFGRKQIDSYTQWKVENGILLSR